MKHGMYLLACLVLLQACWFWGPKSHAAIIYDSKLPASFDEPCIKQTLQSFPGISSLAQKDYPESTIYIYRVNGDFYEKHLSIDTLTAGEKLLRHSSATEDHYYYSKDDAENLKAEEKILLKVQAAISKSCKLPANSFYKPF